MKMSSIDCGFIRLTDSAVLIAALEMGFAAEERIDLILHRESNWSSIRDKIAMGTYPVAHMLAPMPVALSMGLGPMPVSVIAPMMLSQNGNTLSATPEIAALIRDNGGQTGSTESIGKAIAQISKSRNLQIGVPFPHSMHLLLTRWFAETSGADRSRITFTVAPPAILPQVIAAREVDLVVVGEPWGSVAVEKGDTEILMPTSRIWNSAPEKVLGMRQDWAEDDPDSARRLIRALYRSAQWCTKAESRGTLAEILALPQYLDVPSDIVERALSGEMVLNASGDTSYTHGTIRLGGGDVNYPWRSAGMWIGEHAAQQWGVARRAAIACAAGCFSTELYRQSLQPMGVELPSAATRIEGGGILNKDENMFFNGASFTYSDE